LECERLQRELDALNHSAKLAPARPVADSMRMGDVNSRRATLASSSSKISRRPAASGQREPSLRYIFTHIRDRTPCR
jgi:hypothetical protein